MSTVSGPAGVGPLKDLDTVRKAKPAAAQPAAAYSATSIQYLESLFASCSLRTLKTE